MSSSSSGPGYVHTGEQQRRATGERTFTQSVQLLQHCHHVCRRHRFAEAVVVLVSAPAAALGTAVVGTASVSTTPPSAGAEAEAGQGRTRTSAPLASSVVPLPASPHASPPPASAATHAPAAAQRTQPAAPTRVAVTMRARPWPGRGDMRLRRVPERAFVLRCGLVPCIEVVDPVDLDRPRRPRRTRRDLGDLGELLDRGVDRRDLVGVSDVAGAAGVAPGPHRWLGDAAGVQLDGDGLVCVAQVEREFRCRAATRGFDRQRPAQDRPHLARDAGRIEPIVEVVEVGRERGEQRILGGGAAPEGRPVSACTATPPSMKTSLCGAGMKPAATPGSM